MQNSRDRLRFITVGLYVSFQAINLKENPTPVSRKE